LSVIDPRDSNENRTNGRFAMTVPLRAMPRFLKPASVGLAGALLLLSNGFAKAEWPNPLEAKAIAEEGFQHTSTT
jgi:hypothetical protein